MNCQDLMLMPSPSFTLSYIILRDFTLANDPDLDRSGGYRNWQFMDILKQYMSSFGLCSVRVFGHFQR